MQSHKCRFLSLKKIKEKMIGLFMPLNEAYPWSISDEQPIFPKKKGAPK